MERVYIFGAHSRARTLKAYLEKLNPQMLVIAYLFDNEEVNPEVADGIPVLDISKETVCATLEKSASVYLGVKGINQEKASNHLRSIGFEKIIPLTVEMDTQLRNKYVKTVLEEDGREFRKLDELADEGTDDRSDICIYVASSAFDGTLTQKHEYLPFEQKIQVGTALTDKRLEQALYDDQGENISERNQQFCELTALYWIWKNAIEEYVGLEHYRRFFSLPDHIAEMMEHHGIDVVLPVPLYVAPSVRENYRFRHHPKVWDDMMECLKERDVKEYEAAVRFFEKGLYSPCNMLIARKEVFDRLCEWMFPILFAVAQANGKLEDRYQNRYPGFLSERLISFFFDYHREKYQMVYADKVFLQ